MVDETVARTDDAAENAQPSHEQQQSRIPIVNEECFEVVAEEKRQAFKDQVDRQIEEQSNLPNWPFAAGQRVNVLFTNIGESYPPEAFQPGEPRFLLPEYHSRKPVYTGWDLEREELAFFKKQKPIELTFRRGVSSTRKRRVISDHIFLEEARNMSHFGRLATAEILGITRDHYDQLYIAMEKVGQANGLDIQKFLKHLRNETLQKTINIRVKLVLMILKLFYDQYSNANKLRLHNDIKPANFMLVLDTEVNPGTIVDANNLKEVRVIDFGSSDRIATAIKGIFDGISFTPKYAALATIKYSENNLQTEIESLALVCYEILTGESFHQNISNWQPTKILFSSITDNFSEARVNERLESLRDILLDLVTENSDGVEKVIDVFKKAISERFTPQGEVHIDRENCYHSFAEFYNDVHAALLKLFPEPQNEEFPEDEN